MVIPVLANYVNGRWVTPNAAESLEVRNPATAEIWPGCRCRAPPMSTRRFGRPSARSPTGADAGDRARRIPVQVAAPARRPIRGDCRTITIEAGKTMARRAPSCVAASRTSRSRVVFRRWRWDITSRTSRAASTRSCFASRLEWGRLIVPFNFPAIIPLWFLPYGSAAATASSSSPPNVCR